VINGQNSDWLQPNAGVPQGSILGPLLFLVFVNDITNDIESNIHIFADDTSLMEILENYIESYAKINRDLERLSTWAAKWLVTFNATKTVYIKISRKVNPAPLPVLILNGIVVREVQTHKHLGLTFNQTLTWSDHIEALTTKAAKCVGLLRRICRDVPRECLEILFKSMIRPLLEYGSVIFDGSADTHLKRLENVQCQAAITCTGAYRHTSHDRLLEELGWPPLGMRRKHLRLGLMFRIQGGLTPMYLFNACPALTRDRTIYDLRSGMNITVPPIRTTSYQKSFFPQTISDWNELNPAHRNVGTLSTFKEHLKKSSGFKTNKLYHHDSNKAAINHTRIRLGLSGLSSQRSDYNHIDNPRCVLCNAPKEDPSHFFLTCPVHEEHRVEMMTGICDIYHANNIEIEFRLRRFRENFIITLLKGNPAFTPPENKLIFQLTQNFIKNTQRFP
jgi:hypothetical protein